jgi:putative ATPase
VLAQQYPPAELTGRDYYHPSQRGAERELSERLTRLRAVVRGSSADEPDREEGGAGRVAGA